MENELTKEGSHHVVEYEWINEGIGCMPMKIGFVPMETMEDRFAKKDRNVGC